MNKPLPDRHHRRIFYQPVMIQHLAGRALPPGKYRVTPLERVDGQNVTDNDGLRISDIIWKLRVTPISGGKTHAQIVYLLLELQSTPDVSMPLRMMSYTTLLLLALQDEQQFPRGKLPPILPVVFYIGKRRWTIVTEVRKLQAQPLPELDDDQPIHGYRLLDTRSPELQSGSREDPVAALAVLEHANSHPQVVRVIRQLLDLLSAPKYVRLRRAFVLFVRWKFLPKGARLPRNAGLQEIAEMLENDGQTFWDEVRDQLRDQLREELREQIAIQERNKGIRTGEKRGLKKGIKEGELKCLRSTLCSQLKARFGRRLPVWVTERLAGANEADLQRWSLRFAKANRTLKQIFLS